ncbi:MAG: carboxymuconolactone decarboxylase family protein [Gammaproteobacteria bacterium]
MAALGDWRNSDLFSEVERVALEYAEAMTLTGEAVSDELFESLKKHFDEAQIVELTAGIAMENMRSKFNPTLKIESQGFCVLPNA